MSNTPRPLISCVAIVKNESSLLRRCLDSVRPIVDEWCLVDTGSTDGTQAIIQEYSGQPAVEIPFVNFVDTKNQALALATGAYILYMDADEIMLTGADKLREYAVAGVDAVMTPIVEGSDTEIACTYLRYRLWKNKPEHRFVGPGVHEVIAVSGDCRTDRSILVRHDHAHRTPESYQARSNFYVEILKGYLAQHPDDTRAMFYLARTYRDLNLPLLSIEHYLAYLDMRGGYRDEHWQAAFDVAQCWKGQGEYDKAEQACRRAIEIDLRRAEAWNLLGELAANRQDWPQALKHYQMAANLPLPADVILFLDPRAHSVIPQEGLALCYAKLKDYRKALEIYRTLNPAKPDTRLIDNIRELAGAACLKIFFTLGHTPEPVYGGMIDQIGVGGVETAYLELATALAARGHQVFVFCACEREHVAAGVRFVPHARLHQYADLQPNVVVTSRWFDPLFVFPGAKRIIWLQDAHYADPAYPTAWQRADAVIVSSRWHQHYTVDRLRQNLDAAKLSIIPLGIRKAMFLAAPARDPLKVIYSSNPDRGLFVLKNMWPEITRQVPGVHLAITYGWEGLRTWGQDPAWQAKIESDKQTIEGWAAQAGNIVITGRLPKHRLYAEMLTSALCLYPNTFWETFCLTALETQAAGTPMVTTNLGALATTLDLDSNVLLTGDPWNAHYQRQFVDRAVALLTDAGARGRLSANCRNYVAATPCDWTDVAEQWERLLFKAL